MRFVQCAVCKTSFLNQYAWSLLLVYVCWLKFWINKCICLEINIYVWCAISWIAPVVRLVSSSVLLSSGITCMNNTLCKGCVRLYRLIPTVRFLSYMNDTLCEVRFVSSINDTWCKVCFWHEGYFLCDMSPQSVNDAWCEDLFYLLCGLSPAFMVSCVRFVSRISDT